MGRSISIFSGYSQKENRVTNYCLLILKIVYEENPKFLGEILSALIGGEDISNSVGVTFKQQERLSSGIPDGIIVQKALRVHIETKNWDWFYDEQLERHLDDLAGLDGSIKILLALGNFELDVKERFSRVSSLCMKKYQGSIFFAAVTFEDFLGAFKRLLLSKNVSDTISDFRQFLNEENLLPSWRDWLDVVNCAGLFDEVLSSGVYMCPTQGGSYNHDRCRFFGMYREKKIEMIAEIEAVVDVDLGSNTTIIRWNNSSRESRYYEEKAKEKVTNLRPNEASTRVFLLGKLIPTNCRKDSPGGMQQSKRYFSIERFKSPNAEDLARQLNGVLWSDL
jgi:hypothetical protein